MPDQPRRLAVIVVAGAVMLGLLSPLTARSASPLVAEAQRLSQIVEAPASALDRGSAGRDFSASQSLAQFGGQIGAEVLSPVAYADPPSFVMRASLIRKGARVGARVAGHPAAGTLVNGRATWYCCTRGYRGLAVVALPGALGGHFDPAPASWYVTVCADRCVRLPVVDYCGCYWGTASQKVADLSPEAWAAVSDKGQSAGVISVSLHFE